jgi:hypothetical protein
VSPVQSWLSAYSKKAAFQKWEAAFNCLEFWSMTVKIYAIFLPASNIFIDIGKNILGA